MKNILSFLLVVVVAVSMFGFIKPIYAQAEDDTHGKIVIHHRSGFIGYYRVRFYDKHTKKYEDPNVRCQQKTVTLTSGLNKTYTIPSWVEHVNVEFEILTLTYGWMNSNPLGFFTANGVNSKSRIEVTGKVQNRFIWWHDPNLYYNIKKIRGWQRGQALIDKQ